MVSSAVSVFKRKEDTNFFGRRIAQEAVQKASAILMLYLGLFLSGGTAISVIEGLPFKECLFEAASAIGTVGLSMGITTQLGTSSRIILMLLMFFGRVGGLTLIFAAFNSSANNSAKLPLEKISIG